MSQGIRSIDFWRRSSLLWLYYKYKYKYKCKYKQYKYGIMNWIPLNPLDVKLSSLIPSNYIFSDPPKLHLDMWSFQAHIGSASAWLAVSLIALCKTLSETGMTLGNWNIDSGNYTHFVSIQGKQSQFWMPWLVYCKHGCWCKEDFGQLDSQHLIIGYLQKNSKPVCHTLKSNWFFYGFLIQPTIITSGKV